MPDDKELKDLFVETENLVFGRVTFLTMKIPLDWKAFSIPRRTDVEAWTESEDMRWVASGYTGIVLVDKDNDLKLPVYINVKRNLDGKSIRQLLDLERRKYKVVETELLTSLDAGYVILRKIFRKFLLFGSSTEEILLKFIFNCINSRRFLILEIPVEDDPYKVLDALKPYLKTLKC